MTVCQLAFEFIILFLVTPAAALQNSTTCKDVTGNGTERTCVQDCLSANNSSCDVRCSGQAQTNITSCLQTCNTKAGHKECKVECVATAGHCEQKLNSGVGTCVAFDCSQSCEQVGDETTCSLECVSGRRCYQQCTPFSQCSLSCRATMEYCQQEILVSPRPKLAVCNSTHCFQRCDGRTGCECSGTNCKQECYDRGCNMTCHRGVKSCTQHCPHGGCNLICFAQVCVKSMPVPPSATINSTPILQITKTMATRQVTMVTDTKWRTTQRSDITPTADAITTWTEVQMASIAEAAVSTTTSIALERSAESTIMSVLHIKTEDKIFDTIFLAVVIPLVVIVVFLLILIVYLACRLKRVKNTGYIATTPAEQTPGDKDNGVQLVPLMKETPDTKVE